MTAQVNSGRSQEQQESGHRIAAASHAGADAVPQPNDVQDDGGFDGNGHDSTPTESSALLGTGNGTYDPESGEQKKGRDWDDLPSQGDASWAREVKMVLKSSPPLMITFFLQFSINATSVFAVGRLGKQQLGAVACEYTTFFSLPSEWLTFITGRNANA